MTRRDYDLIRRFLRGQPKRGRVPAIGDQRYLLCAAEIFYVLQNGCAWANLVKDFPAKSAEYGYFQRFCADGTWARLHGSLYFDCRNLEGREPQPSAAIIDSQSVKSGLNACGETRYDAGKKVKGRRRHTLTDRLGLLLTCDAHSAGIQDGDGAFDRLTTRFLFLDVFIGDGGYAGQREQEATPRLVQIVRRNDAAKGFKVLPKRWIVERAFTRITANRRMARDFERKAETAKAFIQIAMIKLMAKRLAGSSIPEQTLSEPCD